MQTNRELLNSLSNEDFVFSLLKAFIVVYVHSIKEVKYVQKIAVLDFING